MQQFLLVLFLFALCQWSKQGSAYIDAKKGMELSKRHRYNLPAHIWFIEDSFNTGVFMNHSSAHLPKILLFMCCTLQLLLVFFSHCVLESLFNSLR